MVRLVALFISFVSVSAHTCTAYARPITGSACDDTSQELLPKPSFGVDALAISRGGLGHAWLFRPALTISRPAPIVDLKPAFWARFVVENQMLALYEEPIFAVYRPLVPPRLLARFQIVEDTRDAVVFVWGHGFDHISLAHTFVTRDAPQSIAQAVSSHTPVLPLTKASLAHVSTHDARVSGVLVEQAAMAIAVDPSAHATGQKAFATRSHVDVRWHIEGALVSAYAATKYRPQMSLLTQRFEFFEAPSVAFEKGTLSLFKTLWHVDNKLAPVTYLVTEDVPEDLLEAVCQGIVYWNHAAQKRIVQVVTHVSRDTVAKQREVMVRWIPYDDAVFSRADIQIDPKTGELVAADVYIASSFGAEKNNILVKSFAGPPPKTDVGPHGLCQMPRDDMTALEVMATYDDGVEESVKQRARNDNTRRVVAHEVGHTLGLRHNFAASTEGTSAPFGDVAALYAAYLNGTLTTGWPSASSVMDYVSGLEGLLLGGAIKTQALSYDTYAMALGYNGFEPNQRQRLGVPIFCSDMLASTGLMGCQAHDSGHNPLRGAVTRLGRLRQLLPVYIKEALVDAVLTDKDAWPSAHARLSSIDLSALIDAAVEPLRQVYMAMTSNSRNVLTREAHRLLGDVSESVESEAHERQAIAWLDDIGGLPGALAALLGDGALIKKASVAMPKRLAVALYDDIARTLLDKKQKPSRRLDGQSFVLDDGMRRAVKKALPKVVDRLEDELIGAAILAVTTGQKSAPAAPQTISGLAQSVQQSLATAKIDSGWEAPLANLARVVILKQKPVALADASRAFAQPFYSQKTRLAALNLVSPAIMATPGFAQNERQFLLAALAQRLQQALAAHDQQSRLRHTTPLSRLHWVQHEAQLLQALQAMQPANSIEVGPPGRADDPKAAPSAFFSP